MIYRRWRNIAMIVMVFAMLLAACAREVTPEPTEEPPATAVEDTTDTEGADAEDAEATEEATEEAMDDMDAEATEEATEEAIDDMDAEATEEVTEEAMDDMDAEATEEATEEAIDDMDAEATEEATEEAMDDMDAEATEEATEEAMDDMDSEEQLADLVSSDDAELGIPYSFDYPMDFEVTSGSADAAILTRGDQKVVVIDPASYASVLGSQEFESDADELAFFLDRSGYDVGEETSMMMGLVSLNIALPRAGQVGVANLVDLENNRRGVVIELAPDEDSIPGAVGAAVMDSIVYPPDLVDVASNTEGFSTLVAAVDAAGLDLRSGEYTVFAPTDEAFEAALEALDLTAEELLADTETLTSILNYHLVEGVVLAEDVVALDGEEVTTVNGATLTVGVTDDGVTLTDANGTVANVVTTDVEANNGVIHVIDTVLLPPAPEEADSEAGDGEASDDSDADAEATTQTVVGLTIGDEDLSTLATALLRAGLVGDLNSEGPFTVFAPTNAAFADALESLELTADELLDDRELLTNVLTYHVIEGAVMSGDLEDGMEVTTLNGDMLVINVTDDGVTVTDSSGSTYNVVTADVEASNGVVHVIDGVLLPTSDSE